MRLALFSNLRAELRQQYDLPCSPTDAPPQRTSLQKHVGTPQIADKDGKILQFAIAPIREAREYAGPTESPIKQSLVSTRRCAL